MRDLTFVTNKFQEFVSTFVVIGNMSVYKFLVVFFAISSFMVLAFGPNYPPACGPNEYCSWYDGGELPLGSCQMCFSGMCTPNDSPGQ